MLLCNSSFAQIKVIQFNAGWNSANDVAWVMDLEDCKTISYSDIAKDTESQVKHKIATARCPMGKWDKYTERAKYATITS